MYTEKFEFEWDPAKAQSNREKHGVSFEEAMTAFDDFEALRVSDPKHSTELEAREWLIGASDAGVLVVVYTLREGVRRLISARKANSREKKRYEASKEVPQRFPL